MKSLVPLVWRDSMVLRDTANVGSHARLYHTKVPTMYCTRLICLSESGALVSYLQADAPWCRTGWVALGTESIADFLDWHVDT